MTRETVERLGRKKFLKNLQGFTEDKIVNSDQLFYDKPPAYERIKVLSVDEKRANREAEKTATSATNEFLKPPLKKLKIEEDPENLEMPVSEISIDSAIETTPCKGGKLISASQKAIKDIIRNVEKDNTGFHDEFGIQSSLQESFDMEEKRHDSTLTNKIENLHLKQFLKKRQSGFNRMIIFIKIDINT